MSLPRLLLVGAALFAVTATVARASTSARPPAPKSVSAALDRHGARHTLCIQPKTGVYVCVYDYRGYCVEVELAWQGSWTRFPGHVLAARKGRCYKPQPSTPPA